MAQDKVDGATGRTTGGDTGPASLLPPLLLALTVVTGMVDAVSYLMLGHVFVANMTGNIVLLGFALAGAGGLSIASSLVALAGFVAGAIAGGRLGGHLGAQRVRLLTTAIMLEAVLVAVALAAAMIGGGQASGAVRYDLLALLALAMGLQAATARRVGVPDLSTVVLTMTLTGLAADSLPAGGSGAKSGRRLAALAAMCSGALVGGLLALHRGVKEPIGLAAGLLLLTGLAGLRLSSRAASPAHPPS